MQHLLTVVPVVGLLSRVEEFKPALNADEVDAIFDVPLDMFLKVFIIASSLILEFKYLFTNDIVNLNLFEIESL